MMVSVWCSNAPEQLSQFIVPTKEVFLSRLTEGMETQPRGFCRHFEALGGVHGVSGIARRC